MANTLYYECCIGSEKNRGNFIKADNVSKLYNAVQNGYRLSEGLIFKSVYAYDESVLEYHKTNKSMKGYTGKRYLEEVVFDIDKKDNTDEYTRSKTMKLLQLLEDIGIEEDEYQIYWSGRAWHIHTANYIWGFNPSEDLPYIVKESIRKLLDPLGKSFYDESIYMATGMFRLANSRNLKSQLFKIPVSKQEFLTMPIEDIKQLATKQRLDFQITDFNEILESQKSKLAKHIIKDIEIKKELTSYSKTLQKSNVAICIHKLIDLGAREGNRNNSLLRIATHLRRQNIPEDFTIAGLLNGWNHKNQQGLEPDKIESMVKQCYRSPYNYGCNDKLLSVHCRPECIFYQHKNYSQHVLSTEDMMQELCNYRDMEREGRTIDLAHLFGLNADIIAEPGDLIMVIGGTGVNKTTLKQQIILAQNFQTGKIEIDKQIPTLNIELELTTPKFMRRITQQICGVTKQEATRNFDLYKDRVKEAMSNIVFTREIRNISNLRQKIIDTGAKLIAIDYLQCFKDYNKPINEAQLMMALPHELRDLANEMQVIIMVLSQVTKEAKKEKSVSMDSGKGSGDIADSASIIITINGDPNDIYRKIKFEKVTDGNTTDDIILQFNPDNFKLEKIGEI